MSRQASTPAKDASTVTTDTGPETTSAPAAKKVSLTHRLYTGEISYDFVGHRRRWYIISAALLVISGLALLINGLNMGIEFRGGVDFQAPVQVTSSTVSTVRDTVEALAIPGQDDITVTTIGDGQVRVQTKPLTTEQVALIKRTLANKLGITPDQVAYSQVGASWGQQITGQALIALGVFLVLVMALIWVYFRDFKMSISAIVALIHDLIITVGIYALVGFTVTPATMIGVLTILGYSLYDTVVVFDKVRENTRDLTNSTKTYSQAANTAVNQVLVRSLNTTIIGVLPVAALLITGWFVLGTGPLKDLGLALFVGMIVGAYSSIFIATPLLAQMRERDSDMVEHRERLDRRAKRNRTDPRGSARTTTTKTVTLDVGAPDDAPVSTPGLVDAKKVAARQQPNKRPRSQRKS